MINDEINNCIKEIEGVKGIRIDTDSIIYDDNIYEMISNADVDGIPYLSEKR